MNDPPLARRLHPGSGKYFVTAISLVNLHAQLAPSVCTHNSRSAEGLACPCLQASAQQTLDDDSGLMLPQFAVLMQAVALGPSAEEHNADIQTPELKHSSSTEGPSASDEQASPNSLQVSWSRGQVLNC